MTEVAHLRLTGDSSGLLEAVSVLDSLPQKGQKAQNAADGVEKSIDATSRAAKAAANEMTAYQAALGRLSKELGGNITSFDDLRRSVDPAYAAMKRMEAVQSAVAVAVREGQATQEAANLVLQEAARKFLGVVPPAEKAAQAQREAAQAALQLQASYEQVRASVDPLFAASKRYETAQEQVTAAVRAGIITQQEANRVLDMAANTYLTGAGQAATQAADGMGKYAFAATNAGYQIQDFAVQVASGQSAMVAMTQQLPQLLGAFGMTGKMALFATGAGTAVAVLGALYPVLQKAITGTVDFEDALGDLTDAVSDYQSFADMAKQDTDELADSFGDAAGAARGIASYMAEFARVEGIQKMQAAVESLTETFGGLDPDKLKYSFDFRSGAGGVTTQLDDTYADLRKELNLTEEQADAVVGALYRLNKAATVGEQVDEAHRLYESWVQVFGSIEAIPTELMNAAKQAGLLALQAGKLIDPAERARLAEEKRGEAASKLIADYQQQAAISRAIAILGEDSAEVERLRRDAALATVNAMIEQEGFSGDVAANVRASAMEAYDADRAAALAADSLDDAATQADRLREALKGAAAFSAGLDNSIAVIEAEIAARLAGEDASIAAAATRQRLEAAATRDAAIAAGQSADAAQAAYEADLLKIDALSALVTKNTALAEADRNRSKAGTAASKLATKELRDQEKAAKDLADAIEKAELDADPVKRYRAEVAKLDALLAGGLSIEAYNQALRETNAEFIRMIPGVNEAASTISTALQGGFDDAQDAFEAFAKSFYATIADMIAYAAVNKIVVGIGSAALGGAASGTGGIASALVSGGTSAAAGAGLKAAFGGAAASSAAGGAITTAQMNGLLAATTAPTQGLTLAAATPALMAAGGILAAGALLSYLSGSKKRVTTDQLQGSISGVGDSTYADVERLTTITKTRNSIGPIGGGSSRKTTVTPDYALAMAVSDYVSAAQSSIMASAEAIGVGADAFQDFEYSFVKSIKGASAEEQAQIIQSIMDDASAAFALMVPDLEDFVRSGEQAHETIVAMAEAIGAVNDVAGFLGHTLAASTLAGGDAARQLVELFGGGDEYGSAMSAYMDAFLTDAERTEFQMEQLAQAVESLGLTMPETRDAYEALVASMDINSEAGRTMYAALIQLAGAFDEVLPQVTAFTAAMQAIAGQAVTGIDSILAELSDISSTAESAARQWATAETTLQSFLDSLSGGTGPTSLDVLASRVSDLYAAAVGGDAAAANDYAGAAQEYLTTARANSSTMAQYRIAEARIANQATELVGAAQVEQSIESVVQTLAEAQIAVLTDLKTALESGTDLTQESLNAVALGVLDMNLAMQVAQGLSYSVLKEGLASVSAGVGAVSGTVAEGTGSTASGLSDVSGSVSDASAAATTSAAEIAAAMAGGASGIAAETAAAASAVSAAVGETTSSIAAVVSGVSGVTSGVATGAGSIVASLGLMSGSLSGGISGVSGILSSVLAGVELNADMLGLLDNSSALYAIADAVDGTTDGVISSTIYLSDILAAVTDEATLEALVAEFEATGGEINASNSLLAAILTASGTGSGFDEIVAGLFATDASGGVIASNGLLAGILGAVTSGTDLSGIIDGLDSYAAALADAYDLEGASFDMVSAMGGLQSEITRLADLMAGQIEAEQQAVEDAAAEAAAQDAEAARLAAIEALKTTIYDASAAIYDAQTAAQGYDRNLSDLQRGLDDARSEDGGGAAREALRLAREIADLEASRPDYAAQIASLQSEIDAALAALVADYGVEIPGFATGGDHNGGWRIVGENGPELEATGSARIFNAGETAAILGAANAPRAPSIADYHASQTVAQIASPAPEMQRDNGRDAMAEKLDRLIALMERAEADAKERDAKQETRDKKLLAEAKATARQLQQWEIIGQPEVRTA